MSTGFGIVAKNVANLHHERSADSEQVSQAIMGQPVRILRDDGDWLQVETWDEYQGWIQSRWVVRDLSRSNSLVTVTSLFTDAISIPDPEGDLLTKLVITTALECIGGEGGFACVRLPDGREAWVPGSDVEAVPERRSPQKPGGEEIIRTAKRFLGVPYLWGGTTPFGLDCSGFTQLVYKINGMRLLRDAYMQAGDPRALQVEQAELAPGDLVFFSDKEGEKITHVGMACGDEAFIHSAGSGVGVTINRLDDEPYRERYLRARRMR